MESVDYIQSEIRNNQNFETSAEINRQKFKIVNQVGIIYAIELAFLSQIGEIYFIMMKKFFPNFFKTNEANLILLGTLIVNDIIGMLLIFLMTRFIKKITIKRSAYGCKKFIGNLFINDGLVILVVIIEYLAKLFFDSFLNKNFSKNQTDMKIYKVIKNSNIFLKIFIICLTGPICEEFIFRKFLIDRLAVYSKTLAIFSSGILFGIIHCNFVQFFIAIVLGWTFAYTYVETGNILITITYHIYHNSFLIFLESLSNKDFINNNQIITKIQIAVSFLRLIGGLVGIIILIIYRKKIKVTGEENKSGDKWKFFKSYGMWIFIFEGFLLFSISYMNKLFI